MSTYFVKFSLSLSIYLYLYIYLSTYSSIYIFFYLYILLSIYSSSIYIHLSIHSSIYLCFMHLSIFLSICPIICLSMDLSIKISQGLILIINFSDWLPSYNELLLATHHPERHSTQVNSHSKKCSSHILIVHYSFVIVKRVLLFFSTKGLYTFVNTKCLYYLSKPKLDE